MAKIQVHLSNYNYGRISFKDSVNGTIESLRQLVAYMALRVGPAVRPHRLLGSRLLLDV